VRNGGFCIIPISATFPGLQVVYLIMMYISVYPVVINMRHSNLYEERSLGIYANDPRSAGNMDDSESHSILDTAGTALRRTFSFQGVGVPVTAANEKQSRLYFINQQIRSQLAHDLWWLSLAVVIITISERKTFSRFQPHSTSSTSYLGWYPHTARSVFLLVCQTKITRSRAGGIRQASW
jgi:Trk-type K+ transport system membrane component